MLLFLAGTIFLRKHDVSLPRLRETVPHQDARNCGWEWVSPAAPYQGEGAKAGFGCFGQDSHAWLHPSCARTEPAGHRGDVGCQATLGHVGPQSPHPSNKTRACPREDVVTGNESIQATGVRCRGDICQAEVTRDDCFSNPCFASKAPAVASLSAFEVQPAGRVFWAPHMCDGRALGVLQELNTGHGGRCRNGAGVPRPS